MAVSKTRRIKVMDATYISPLQMYGPLVQPMTINEGIVYDLVRKLYHVVEINSDKKEVKLSIMNFNDPNRFGGEVPTVQRHTPTAKVVQHSTTTIHDNTVSAKPESKPVVKLPENIALREVVKDTAIVPPAAGSISIPTVEISNSSEPITNELDEEITPAIPLPTAVEEEALTADGASNNNDVNDSVINDDEGIDEDDEPEEDSDETSGDGSVTSSAASTSPSNKKKHNRGKKHR